MTASSFSPVHATCNGPKRVGLFERDGAFPVELEQRKEPRDDLQSVLALGNQFVEPYPDPGAALLQDSEDQGRLLGYRYGRHVQVVETDRGNRLGPERGSRDLREALGVDAEDDVGHQVLEAFFEGDRARVAAQGGTFESGELLGDEFVGPVLKEPREQQVAGFEEGEVFGIVDVAGRKQPCRFEIEQGRRDDEKLRGLIETHFGSEPAGVGDEFVGDLVERYFGHVEAALGDQAEQQIEGAFEVAEAEVETGGPVRLRGDRRRGLCDRCCVRGSRDFRGARREIPVDGVRTSGFRRSRVRGGGVHGSAAGPVDHFSRQAPIGLRAGGGRSPPW